MAEIICSNKAVTPRNASDATKAQSSHGQSGQRRICFLHELLVFVTVFWDQQAKTWMFLFPNAIWNREAVQALVVEELFSINLVFCRSARLNLPEKESLSVSQYPLPPPPRFFL